MGQGTTELCSNEVVRAAQGVSAICRTINLVSCVFPGARAADGAFAGKWHRLLQSREFTAILHAHNAAHYRRGCSFVHNSERVSCLF